MRFLSCFSGIEAASVAFEPLGWRCVGVAEVDKAASRLLARKYPDVPNLGDVMAPDFIARAAELRPDILVGGPPCQDFSVAGLRAGLAGDRGNLTLRWVEIIRAIRPSLALTENVPGWLYVNRGHAFGAFLAALVGCDSAIVPPRQCGGRWSDAGMVDGPEGRCAWRTLDAQFFGLAQRRRRVFVVADFGGGADPAEILFERQGLRWNPPPRREAREVVAADAQGRAGIGFGGGRTAGPVEQAACLTSHGQRLDFEVETFVAHALRGEGFDASEDGTGRGTPLVPVAFRTSPNCGAWETGDRTDALTTTTDPAAHVLCFQNTDAADDPSGGSSRSYVADRWAVRRLTPEECEALQGFPRGYTAGQADGPRYKQIGNSWPVNVARWIGERIDAALRRQREEAA